MTHAMHNLSLVLDFWKIGTVRTEVPYEQTRHRYPWICSLRGRGPDKQHHCAVTLLRRPPGPTVLVTAAHCTFLCKSDNIVVPNCCCDNVAQTKCSEDRGNCGANPRVVEMTGQDVEIICGEWEIGNIPQQESGEEYNLILPIEEITRHPDFNISLTTLSTNYIQKDIAVIKVSNENQAKGIFVENKINPACLPTTIEVSASAIHSGWSNPPPFYFIQSFAPLFSPFYRDFSKQWHHKMLIAECKDPTCREPENPNCTVPSNTFYPPGVICAKEMNARFCPSSGESGSTLISQAPDESKKMSAIGILSFIKGCTEFRLGGLQDYVDNVNTEIVPIQSTETQTNAIIQYADHPLVYTKIGCQHEKMHKFCFKHL